MRARASVSPSSGVRCSKTNPTEPMTAPSARNGSASARSTLSGHIEALSGYERRS